MTGADRTAVLELLNTIAGKKPPSYQDATARLIIRASTAHVPRTVAGTV